MPARRVKVLKRVLKDDSVRWTGYYVTPQGQWLSAGTHRDRAVARVSAEEAWRKSQQPGWIDPAAGKETLHGYAMDHWIPSLVVEVKTRIDYESCFANHVDPAFGSRPLASILPSDVGAWINHMEETGVGRSTARKAYRILNMILKSARRDQLIPYVATEDVKSKPVPKHRPKIFSRGQWAKFLAEVPEQWRPLCEVGVGTGMRESELRALCPAHVFWERGTARAPHIGQIMVAPTDVQVSATLNGGAKFVRKEYPKSGDSRLVDVDEHTLDILADAIDARGLDADSLEPIFVGADGRPFDQHTLWKMFNTACAAAGIPHLSPKQMRSTRASWLLKATGGDIMYVKDQLGHADISTTQKYLAVVEEVDTDNVSSFEKFRNRRGRKEETG